MYVPVEIGIEVYSNDQLICKRIVKFVSIIAISRKVI